MKLASGLVTSWMAVAAAGVLVACGGGGSDPPSPPAPAPPPTAAALALSGTAATGAAIAGAAVDVVCSGGTASGTTRADGGYDLSVTGGSLPCVLRVTSGGSVLHSLAWGASGSASARANITPLTQLVVAYYAALDPAAYYAGFSSASAPSVSASGVAAAQAWLVALLQSAGIDATASGDLISATLVPRTSGSAGSAYAQALDQLASTLTSAGTSLPSLTAAVAVSGGAPGDGTASLPPELLLTPAAGTCSALHSGSYRVVSPLAHSTLANQFSTMTIDATTLTVNRSDVGAAAWSANGSCRFSGPGGLTDALVSPAGVIVMRYAASASASYRWAVAFPEQSHTLNELAGHWNMMGIAANATGFTGITASATVDAAGAQSAVTRCQNDATWSVKAADCSVPAAPAQSFVADSAGGFDLVNAGTVSGRAFAYRSGSGDLMLAEVQADGSFQLRTRQSNTALPKVGRFVSGFDMYVSSALVSPSAFDPFANTIVSVDAAAKSWVRVTSNGGSAITHQDSLLGDNPRSGYNFRPPGTATASNGSTVTINEYTLMPLTGMGLSPLLLPASKLFDLSTGVQTVPSTPPTGGVAACSPLSLPAGSTVQAVLFNATFPTLGGTFTQTSNGPVRFEGNNAIELHLTAPVIGAALDAKVYLSIDGTGAMTEYGQHAVVSTSAGSSDTYTVLTPPVVDREFALAPGESTPSLTVTQLDTTINTLNGVASPPVTQTTTHTIAPKTFVGIESVTVPAGTFNTCRFTEPQTNNGVTSTFTRWLLVGYGGAEVKNSQGSTATSVLFNGVALSSN